MITESQCAVWSRVERTQRAVAALLKGDPEPAKELWSRRDDVTLANQLHAKGHDTPHSLTLPPLPFLAHDVPFGQSPV